MIRRQLGRTGIEVSACCFGCGPIPELMTGEPTAGQQALVEHAIEQGINWFDTAASYGEGSSERNLGSVLKQLGHPAGIHLATKVRLMPGELGDVAGTVRRSVEQSLEALGVERVTLLQLHNAVTSKREEEPTSVSPADVLDPEGILAAMQVLKEEGLVDHLGLTGIGQAGALREVIQSGGFATIQAPYNRVNPTACRPPPAGFKEVDYGQVLEDCAELGMGVFAIRVFAGGALLDQAPAQHTYKTRFFPLDLYQRDLARAGRIAEQLDDMAPDQAALRFVLSEPLVSSAIIGFSQPLHVDRALLACEKGALDEPLIEQLLKAAHG
jgi:aryl-alcohol dehydrogenase-like predicted oxidoreductase